MNRLSEFAVAKPTIVVSFVVVMVIGGIISFLTMPRREDPEFTLKVCVVSTRWQGASAEQVERLITDPLEKAIDSLEEVRLIRSHSLSEQSVIFVELEEWVPGFKVDGAWERVRARVQNVQLPDPSIVPFVNDEFADTSIIVFAVHQTPLQGESELDPSNAYTPRDLDNFSNIVRDAISLLPGVAKVDRHGVQEEAIYIESSAGNWAQLGLSTADVEALARSQNIVAPGGQIDTADGRFFVKPNRDVHLVDEMEQLVVGTVSSSAVSNQVRVKDIGLNVRRGYIDPITRACRYGDPSLSVPAVMVAVSMKSGANIVDICDAAKQCVKQLIQTGGLPPDISVSVISDQSLSVKGRIHEVLVNVIEAIAIVVVFVYLFVGFRTAAVMAANIPFVVLISLAIIPAFGVQLEQMSLASMIIALGLLVDNAVQICDQTMSNQISGMQPKQAAVQAAQLLGASMLNGTLTTIAAFIPMVIAMDGSNREFIYSLPITLSVMLTVSWLLAMTFCVILASWFIRPPADPRKPMAPIPWLFSALSRVGNLDRWPFKILRRFQRVHDHGTFELGSSIRTEGMVSWLYGKLLRFVWNHRVLTLLGAFVLLLLAFQLPVSTEFFPLTQRNQFAVKIYLPESSSVDQTDRIARQVEDAIRKVSAAGKSVDDGQIDRLLNMRTMIGGGGSRWYLSWEPEIIKPNFAEILIQTSDGKLTHEFAEHLRRAVREGDESLGIKPIVGARIVPIELALGPPADPVVLRVVGDGYADLNRLRQFADRIKALIDAKRDTWDVNDSWGEASQQLFVDVSETRMGVTGLRNSDVASSLNALYSGRLLTHFREGNRLLPVYFRLRPQDRQSISDMPTTPIESSFGKVPLSALADIVPQWRSTKIDRRNGNRTIEVRSQIASGASGNDVTTQVFSSKEMDALRSELPAGMRIEVGGALEESQKAQWKMLASFAMSFIAIFILLICQFNSVFRTLIILATLPLALGGALLGLWATNNSFGFMPQLGVLALFGIVLNAAILFVEFADLMVRQAHEANGGKPLSKEELRTAIISAGKQRLMPIFLTTATTVGGLVPLGVSGGPLWVGLAWLLVFGLTFATVLTLVIIPVLYSFQRVRISN
ncbi:efflux RND transporter permease subunit [Pirellulaceae bacterium SH449]